jgi:predicted dehydrogenase
MAVAAVVRYGIVGVGMMGREHLHNLAHLAGEVEREQSVSVRVTCLADPHPESLLLGLRLAASLGLPAPQVDDTASSHMNMIQSLPWSL